MKPFQIGQLVNFYPKGMHQNTMIEGVIVDSYYNECKVGYKNKRDWVLLISYTHGRGGQLSTIERYLNEVELIGIIV